MTENIRSATSSVGITPEGILAQKILSDAQISPDGSFVAFVVADNYKEEGTTKPKSNIWLANTLTNSVFQFSRGPSTDLQPRWSPDGRKVAFLSDRGQGGKFQIYLLPVDGGEAQQVTHAKGEITQVQWSRSGNSIAFLMYDPESEEDRLRLEGIGGAIEFEKHHKFARIHVLDMQTGSEKVIDGGNYHVWEFDWSPDGKYFAAIISDEPYEWAWHISKLAIIQIEDSRTQIIYEPKPKQLGSVHWSPDGSSIYFISARWSDRGLIAGDLFRMSAFGNDHEVVNLSKDQLGSVHYFDWLSSDEMIVLSVDWTRTKFTTLNTSRETFTAVYEGEVALGDSWQPRFTVGKGGTRSVAVVREDLYSPQELCLGSLGQNRQITWRKMTDLNREIGRYSTIKAEQIQWESFDGLKIQGFLYLPSEPRGGRLPLIVHEHGGPSLAYGHKFEMEARYFASHGYAVLLPNPRGSAGRGVRFLEMNRGNIEGDDFKDIMAGVDYCVSNAVADPSNLFVYGGSYGGYLVAWSVTHTDRFNAAVMDFGISNLLSCHGAEWNTYWEIFLFDIDPYKSRELYEKKSPLYYVTQVKTPTLIIHGKDDPCVPVTQGHEFFRALKELGVETELVIYPREGHGWIERKHRIDAWQRHLAWFEGHKNRRESGPLVKSPSLSPNPT